LGSWVETSTVLSTGFNATNESFSTNNQLPGTYTFEYQFDNSTNPCPDVAETVTIIIEQVPVADAGPDFVLNCSDTETTLGGPLTTTGPGISYFWEELSGVAITNNTDQNIIGNTNGVYVLTVLNFASMCLDRDTVVISTDPNSLSFVATPIGSPCFGYNQGMIVIEQINGAQPPVTVSINGAAPIPIDEGDIIENLAPGVYDIDMEDAGGCTASTSLIIVEPDAWTVNAGNDDQIISGDTYGLMVTPSIDQSQISSITWTADSTVICTGAVADCINLDVEPEQLTTYCVEVTDLNGCIATDCVIIQARATKDIYIPNAFSPNGDNNNDWFWIQTDQQLEKLELAVYDRWGEQMFFNDNADVNDPTSFWNGEFNDTKVENGVYVYLLVVRFAGADNDEYFAGDITVIR